MESPKSKPPAKAMIPPIRTPINIHTNKARERFVLFFLLHPPHAQIMSRMRFITGSINRKKMPMYAPVEMGSSV